MGWFSQRKQATDDDQYLPNQILIVQQLQSDRETQSRKEPIGDAHHNHASYQQAVSQFLSGFLELTVARYCHYKNGQHPDGIHNVCQGG